MASFPRTKQKPKKHMQSVFCGQFFFSYLAASSVLKFYCRSGQVLASFRVWPIEKAAILANDSQICSRRVKNNKQSPKMRERE